MFKSKILVADSDKMLLAMLDFRLKEDGHDTVLCADGRETKEKIISEKPDIVICDLHLPSFTGHEIIAYVKKELRLDIPVIILTAGGRENAVVEAFKLGAEDFVSKPFSPAELVIRIDKALEHIYKETH